MISIMYNVKDNLDLDMAFAMIGELAIFSWYPFNVIIKKLTYVSNCEQKNMEDKLSNVFNSYSKICKLFHFLTK
jgi:hypothetical protein